MEFVKAAEDVEHVLKLDENHEPIQKTDPGTGEVLPDEFETVAVRSRAGIEVWESTGAVALDDVGAVVAEALETFAGRDVRALDVVIGGRVSIRIAYEDEETS